MQQNHPPAAFTPHQASARWPFAPLPHFTLAPTPHFALHLPPTLTLLLSSGWPQGVMARAPLLAVLVVALALLGTSQAFKEHEFKVGRSSERCAPCTQRKCTTKLKIGSRERKTRTCVFVEVKGHSQLSGGDKLATLSLPPFLPVHHTPWPSRTQSPAPHLSFPSLPFAPLPTPSLCIPPLRTLPPAEMQGCRLLPSQQGHPGPTFQRPRRVCLWAGAACHPAQPPGANSRREAVVEGVRGRLCAPGGGRGAGGRQVCVGWGCVKG